MSLALFGGKPVRKRPFVEWPIFGKPEEKRLLLALRSGNWGRLEGDEVAEFEKRFATMHGCKHGIAVVQKEQACRDRRCGSRPWRFLQKSTSGIARSHGFVLISIQQESNCRRRRHDHHQQSRPRRAMPLDPQLWARSRRYLVRASHH